MKSFGQYEIDWQTSPSIIEMDRGGIYKIDRHTKCQKMEMPLKWITFLKIFFTGTRMCYYIWSISVAFSCFLQFSIHPFQRHVSPLSISVALSWYIHFRGTSSNPLILKNTFWSYKIFTSFSTILSWRCMPRQASDKNAFSSTGYKILSFVYTRLE